MAINKNDYLDGDGNYYLKKSLVDEVIDEVNTHLAENANKAHGGFKGTLLSMNLNQSIANGYAVILSWQNVVYDTANAFSISEPTKIVIPQGISKVKLSSNINWAVNTVGRRNADILKNATEYNGRASLSVNPDTAGSAELNFATPVINVVPGDFFTIKVIQTSGASLDILAGGRTWFALEVIQ